MSLSMFQASVPVFIKAMNNLKVVLDKGAAHAAANKIDPTVLLNSRLFPDMFPLVRQVQIASDNAKGGGARLAGMTPPKYEDDEASFPELNARIEKTVAFLQTLTPAANRRLGRKNHKYLVRPQVVHVSRPGVSAWTGVAEYLLSRDDRLQHPAPLRRAGRQRGFSGEGVGRRLEASRAWHVGCV